MFKDALPGLKTASSRPPLRALLPALLPALLLVLSATASAKGPTHDIEVDDYFTLALPLSVAFSPDGERVAYTDLRWDLETQERNADLWITRTNGKGVAKRLTFDAAFDHTPTFSPDGTWLYFQSARDSKPAQVYRIGIDGKNLKQITRLSKGVQSFKLSRDGKQLYVATPKKKTVGTWRSLKSRNPDLKYGHGVWTYTVISALNLETWRLETLIDDDRVVVAWDVAPDDSRIAMVTRPTNALISNEGWSRVDIWDAHTGAVTPLPDALWRAKAPSPYGWLNGPSWASDSRTLSFTIDYDGYPSELLIARFGKRSPKPQEAPKIHRAHRGALTIASGQPAGWLGRTHDLVFAAEDHGRERLYVLEDADDPQSEPYVLTAGDLVTSAFDVSRDGQQVAFAMSSPTTFGDVYVAEIEKNQRALRQLSAVNPQVADWKLPTLEIVTWKSPDGTPVEGVLAWPPEADRTKPLPMVVYIHGGPAAATKYRLRFWSYGRTLMAAKGYVTFSPNYRGSTGYGDAFLTDLIGHKNDVDVADILSGVDALVKRGVADPNKLAVMGWSNGGYLTNCVITKTTRFKAASSGAGVFDTAMQWMIEDTPGHVINYQQGLPWQQPDAMRKTSPLYDMAGVTTPTLIHVGEADSRVPPQHARGLHRALHQYLHVPTELVIYPGASHSLSKYAHRRAKMVWDLAWFAKYVLGEKP